MLAVAVVASLDGLTSGAHAVEPTTQSTKLEDVIARHPASGALATLFPDSPAAVPADFAPSGLTRDNYLKLIAGSVDYFKQFQNEQGAIIDEFEKAEKQYSTPCFAYAAAILVDKAGRNDLLDSASRALGFSINALANKTTADKHPDFYIPGVIHALRLLKPHVSAETYNGWAETVKKMVPEKTYVDPVGGGNWNTVNVCGETMRARDGLVAPELMEAHEKYIEKCLTKQQDHALTKFGLYWDGPIVPMAYDAFARLWWEEMIADGYDGPSKPRLDEFLTIGGFSTLLLQSPNGEWASGGRSAQHQWNECEIAVICEINANRWKARGRDDVAGAFKRAARLALSSVQRWQRPSGELFIVKNRAEPSKRLGYEGYSFKTNYGTLPMAMLAMAYERADESIQERPAPSEVGGYVFDVRDVFYKISAAAGGYYVLIDTASDAHYNATGLQRVTRSGVGVSPLNDSAAAHRWYGPKEDSTMAALAPSLAWRTTGDAWTGLPDFLRFKPGLDSKGKVLPDPQQFVQNVDLDVKDANLKGVSFVVHYGLKGKGAAPVTETYALSSDGLLMTVRAEGLGSVPQRVQFPVLVSDGADDSKVEISGNRLSVATSGGSLEYEVTSPADVKLTLDGPRLATHNGYVQAAVGPLPEGADGATWHIRLSPAK
jgi:hypothetical protein